MSNKEQPIKPASTDVNAQEQPLTHEEPQQSRQAVQDLILRYFTIPAWMLRAKGPRSAVEDDEIDE